MFKARQKGSTAFNNPFVAGLMDDLDLGTMDMHGIAWADQTVVDDGKSASWRFLMGSQGITIDPATQEVGGTGYYVLLSALTYTSDGMPGSPAKDGTYNIGKQPNILAGEVGVAEGQSVGTFDFGTWIYRYDNGVLMERAPLMEGDVDISFSDGVHTFVIDALDNGGKKIEGTLNA
jgi:hypothetical protein